MKKILSLLIIVIFLSNTAFAKKKLPSENPKLIVQIVVSQMRYDYLYRYWDKYSDNGFKQLVENGTLCKNAHYNYHLTQNAPGIATIATGTNPSMHGIVADKWYDRLSEEIVEATYDNSTQTIGSYVESGKLSPRNLLSTTISDELKLANNFYSKAIGISINGPEAVLSVGHSADAAYWFDPEIGNWITSSYYLDSLPNWVHDFNLKKYPETYVNREWTTLLPLDQYTESFTGSLLDKSMDKDKEGFSILNLLKIRKEAKSYEILTSTPFGNTFTKDFAITCMVQEELGQKDTTDFLAINFTATNVIGHRFGPSSIEIEDTYIRLDKDLEHLLAFIDETIGMENTLIYLTSDHGVSYAPENLKKANLPGGIFEPNSAIALLNSYMDIIYGNGDWIKFYNEKQIYLNHNLIENTQLSFEEIQSKIALFMTQFTGVSNAVTAYSLQNTYFSEGISNKIQNSFYPKRGGDVILNLEPGWIERSSNASNNNSGYTYDTHVPLIFYGWKIKRNTISRKINMEDIAPTISSMINISFPNACNGEPIYEMLD